MAVSDTLIGTVFDGRYRIVRKLGAGGMADVYLAEDQELGRQVAIKILNDRHAVDDSFIERFRREAKNAAGLSHPEHRLDLRPRRGRGHLLHRDGVPRRPLAQGADRRARAGADQGRDRLRAQHPRGARGRAQAGDRPPRHQAAQRAHRRRGPPEGDRLRDRALRREPDDRGRLDHRHRAVPLARAGARCAGRPDLRPLLGRRRALRDAHRPGSVHGRHAARDRDEAPLGSAEAAVGAAAGDPARPRLGRAARAGQGSERALPERRGDGRRPAPRGRGAAGRPGDRGSGDCGALRARG